MQEAELERVCGFGAQLEEMIIEAHEELSLISAYSESKVWEEPHDEAWKDDLEDDIKRDIEREDAANAKAAKA